MLSASIRAPEALSEFWPYTAIDTLYFWDSFQIDLLGLSCFVLLLGMRSRVFPYRSSAEVKAHFVAVGAQSVRGDAACECYICRLAAWCE